MDNIKLIIGLGNPGSSYENTRHNIGFKAVELFSNNFEGNWKNWHRQGEIFKTEQKKLLIIFKPILYMNNSGQAVKKVMDYYDIYPEQILVVVDDFSIPLGNIRLRLSGSFGGHNGLASILTSINTPNFPRLRLGIGPVQQNFDPKDFVLSKFKREEIEDVEEMLQKAVETMENVLTLGIEKAVSKIKNKAKK
ncbi:MAG: aminoacyl-tRNA hydrolase [Elusimicrobia bacterium]|nr:aminoacyl-tRNA hydrolase [Elusimicrobiota bacterium]